MKTLPVAGVLAVAVAALFAAPDAQAQSAWAPSAVLLQAGAAVGVKSVSAGLTWDWGGSWSIGPGRLGGYWEASLAEWSYTGPDGDRTSLVQLGLKPVFRYRFDDGRSNWFGEAGVGASTTNRRFHSNTKEFSTQFNFGDHLAVGRSFGAAQQDEVALRIEHFSNAGIRQPNPGKTFLQLRYVHRFQ